MRWSVLALCFFTAASVAAPRTVCTITVNSEDERDTFRRHLPESRYRFVELVQRGRADWLEASCQAKVQCDVLVISAHFDGGSTFFSDRVDASEHLTVAELERVSCNGKCPSLFARLKEVYLFGCNTLNPSPLSNAYSEVVRRLLREGRSQAEAERELRSLTAAGGEASRDRMRQIFAGVPVIYGFSSTAPLGAVAGPVLDRYLRAMGDREISRGRPSSRLLAGFSEFGMTATSGVTERDPLAMQREADALELVQERLQRLQRLLERSRDDLAFAEQRQPAPFVQRVAGALRDGAAAIWRYEMFSVGESSQVDGRTITLQHGVTVGKAVGVVLLFVLGWLVASRLSRFFIQLLVRRLQLTPQLGRVLNRWMMALLLLGVLLVVLELAHIPLTAFAFLGGALAIGVGFGTQNIIKNLISGVIILFERKIRVGDVVTIDGVSGTVTSVDLRATTVRGFDGIEAIVPNSQLLENRVSNWSYGNPVVRRSVDVGLRYGSDARAASEAVLECARADIAVLAEPPPEVLFADFGADAQVLRLQYWLRLDGARSGPTVDSELRHAIAVVFAARGLEIAFPQRDVHLDVRHPLDVRVQGAA